MSVTNNSSTPTIALALAGGGPMGGFYELGTLMALQQAIPLLRLHKLPMYVGVSVGSVITSALANQFSITEITQNLLRPDVAEHPIHPSLFYTPAWREYIKRASALPKVSWKAFLDYLRQPQDESLFESLTQLKKCLPSGFFDNSPIEKYLRDLYRQQGATNNFNELEATLLIIAAELDCGHSVVFGQGRWRDVPISKAVQASTCVPGMYTPVRIHDQYFVDGILYKTVHASAAFDAGADIVICINPIVPYCNTDYDPENPESTSIIQEGASGILSQAVRAMVHSRSVTGFRQYERDYPNKDVILFEPAQDDAQWFFANEFSFKNRLILVEQAYKATLTDLKNRIDEINPILAKANFSIEEKNLLPDSKTITMAKQNRRNVSNHMRSLRKSLKQLEEQYLTD